MVDLLAIKGAIDGLKAAHEIAKSAMNLRDNAQFQSKVIELNGAIIAAQSSALDAQADQIGLAQRVEELEQMMANMREWKSTRKRYELVEIVKGVFAYKLKATELDGSPAHFVCQCCFHDEHLAVLQRETRNPGRAKYLVCQRCGAELVTSGMRHPEHTAARWTQQTRRRRR